jgi:hypothetical protein
MGELSPATQSGLVPHEFDCPPRAPELISQAAVPESNGCVRVKKKSTGTARTRFRPRRVRCSARFIILFVVDLFEFGSGPYWELLANRFRSISGTRVGVS